MLFHDDHTQYEMRPSMITNDNVLTVVMITTARYPVLSVTTISGTYTTKQRESGRIKKKMKIGIH